MEDLNGLRVFLRVAESRSFTAAASRLGLTASAVSKAISRLEQEYGVRLFNRTTRHVGLTPDGRDFHERCRLVLTEVEEAENQLTQTSGGPRGRLRVHLPTAFGKKVVLPVLARLLEGQPDLQVDVELGERVVDPAYEGLDAVVRFGELPDSGLVARRLCGVSFVAVAAPAYLARHGEPLTPEDLDQHHCLGYATPWREHYREWSFAPGGKLFGRSMSGRLNVNNAEALTEAAVAGAGIAMVASFVAFDAVQSGQLRVLLKDCIAPPMPVSVVYLPGKQSSPRLRWLLDALIEMIPADPPWEAIVRKS